MRLWQPRVRLLWCADASTRTEWVSSVSPYCARVAAPSGQSDKAQGRLLSSRHFSHIFSFRAVTCVMDRVCCRLLIPCETQRRLPPSVQWAEMRRRTSCRGPKMLRCCLVGVCGCPYSRMASMPARPQQLCRGRGWRRASSTPSTPLTPLAQFMHSNCAKEKSAEAFFEPPTCAMPALPLRRARSPFLLPLKTSFPEITHNLSA